ncbi:hypothetical protein CYMTET_45909 [Cymbomonas tetramitiformis]|uniref:Uncharacterized protein n=1 Tax=Cymbomonas tetramitiformis TaxID=36881 RepID=A0AAE0EXU0_9CHLO|nr:hypothetical protein CYMTET_45909 [Cymbomonas tetramitiformis]
MVLGEGVDRELGIAADTRGSWQILHRSLAKGSLLWGEVGEWAVLLVPVPFEESCHNAGDCATQADDGQQGCGGVEGGDFTAAGLLVVGLNWVDEGGQEDESEECHQSWTVMAGGAVCG